MAPKKTVASEEGIASSKSSNKDEKVSEKAKSESSKAPDVARKTHLHPPTMIMVKEALKELDSRKGVSSQAIRSYITEKYPSLDQVRLKYMMRKALNKGIESGVLARPPNSTASGAQGRFRLAVRGKLKEPKLKATENTDPNVAKASKAGAKKTKEKEAVSERTTAKKEKTSEDAKPKKAPGGSKVAPTKKPKATRPAVEGGTGDQPKALKTTKAAKKGEGAAKKGEGAAKKGEGAAKKGEGAAKKGEGAAKKGEGAAKKGEGAAKKGEGAAKKGEGAAKKGEGAAKKGEGAPAARTTGKRGKNGAAE
ncbi:ribosome-binding protein 1 isoform X1 [Oncorhynchus keta]|uniref:ribosome-binding protein 1 isoform X1 n=2 Tax=Oncorhynchus keta TaxID=8018 RepID=UPI00227D6196|nr:ribosome-binding protein 1 isoform X1 [Oncorhynchus keta]XP_052329770.1 ribosome-binding protein 1 isoform X1 [Oncorhynchus keta]